MQYPTEGWRRSVDRHAMAVRLHPLMLGAEYFQAARVHVAEKPDVKHNVGVEVDAFQFACAKGSRGEIEFSHQQDVRLAELLAD